MWFDSWADVQRILLVGACAYGLLILLLRVSGKRTLSKLNAFDLVITIALGSVLATILLDSTTSLSEGLTALWLLVTLQFVVAVATSRLPRLRGALTAGPTVLLVDGTPQLEAMRRHRIGLEELVQAVRSTGTGDLSLVAAVVLEADGTLSVVDATRAGDGSALPGRESTRDSLGG